MGCHCLLRFSPALHAKSKSANHHIDYPLLEEGGEGEEGGEEEEGTKRRERGREEGHCGR